MPISKTVKVKRWRVAVYQDHVATPQDYVVYATSGLNARVLAFALNGGYPYVMTEMRAGDVELAITYTKIVAST